MNSFSDFFDNLWNKAEGVFDKVIDFKLTDLEIDRAREQALWEFDLRQDALAAPQTSWGANTYTPSGDGNRTLLIVGGVVVVGVVAFVLARK